MKGFAWPSKLQGPQIQRRAMTKDRQVDDHLMRSNSFSTVNPASIVNMSLQWAEYVAMINPPTEKANAVILGAKLMGIRLGHEACKGGATDFTMAPVVLRSLATKGILGVNVPVTKTVDKCCLAWSKGVQKVWAYVGSPRNQKPLPV